MRTVFVGTFVLLMVGLCVAQTDTNNSSATNSQPTLQILPPTQQREFNVDPLPLVTDQTTKPESRFTPQFRFAPKPKLPYQFQSHCYTMRTYMFTEGNGSSPRPKGYTTCVTANQLQLRQAAPKFVPQ